MIRLPQLTAAAKPPVSKNTRNALDTNLFLTAVCTQSTKVKDSVH
jgi:hypothetical protein